MKTKARVLVTLEIDLGGTWGSTCPAEQVFDQARTAAVKRICEIVKERPDFRIVGDSKVTMVMCDDVS